MLLCFQNDLYEVEAVTLRDIKKVILGHNSSAPGKNFYYIHFNMSALSHFYSYKIA